MPLDPGTTLGPYAVTAQIGEARTSTFIEKEIDMRRIVFALFIGLSFSGVASAQDAPPPSCGPA